MAISFMKSGAKAGAAPAAKFPAAGATKFPTSTAQKPAGTSLPSFFKTGKAALEAVVQQEAQSEARKSEFGNLWRFRLKDGESGPITFLNGTINADGMLDVALFREHSIQLNGDWKNFVCTAEMDQSQPCPICESGDRSSLVGVLTVIDHIPRVIQRGANAGKTTKDKKKLYVAKMHTIKILTELAKDCGGSLAGKTFKVSRMGDKAAAVGETFFPLESFDSLEAVAAKYGLTLDDVQPADLEKEIVYRSPEELVAIGAGKSPFVASSAPKGVNDLSNQL